MVVPHGLVEPVRIEVPAPWLLVVVAHQPKLVRVRLGPGLEIPVAFPRLLAALMHERPCRVVVAIGRANTVHVEVPAAGLRVMVAHQAQLEALARDGARKVALDRDRIEWGIPIVFRPDRLRPRLTGSTVHGKGLGEGGASLTSIFLGCARLIN